MDADLRELHALEVDLGRASGRVVDEADEVLERGALNIKDDLADSARRSKSFRRIAETISYDGKAAIGSISYEIGPDRERGGAAKLANIAYFGGAHGGGGTLDLDGPLDREEPKTLRELARVMGGLL